MHAIPRAAPSQSSAAASPARPPPASLVREDRVTLFEADDRLGGHADTHVSTLRRGGWSSRLDTGFIVHNDRTYPTLLRLFAELGVATQDSEMSMSIRDDDRAGVRRGARASRGLFPTCRQSARRALPADARRDHALPPGRAGLPALADGDDEPRRSANFLAASGFSPYFAGHFMEPLVAAVWSCDPAARCDYPARYLFTFLDHHGMLGVFGSPPWRTVTGGSPDYVEAVAARLARGPHRHQVTRCSRRPTGVEVTDGNGAVSSTPSSSPPTRTRRWRLLAEPTAGAARRPGRDALLDEHRAAAHRRLGAAAARRRPGVVELPVDRRAATRCSSPTT